MFYVIVHISLFIRKIFLMSSIFLHYTKSTKIILYVPCHMSHWQLIRSKLGFSFSSGITLDIDVFFLWPTSYWSIEDKTYKKLKEIPSRHVLENLPEKASMYAFIHLKLIGNLQGFCQYIMADMLNITIANYRKYSGVVFLGP